MKKTVLIVIALLVAAVSFSQEHYYEVKKLYLKKPDGTSTLEHHDIEVLFTKSSKTCTVRIDNSDPQIFQIANELYNQQTAVKTYELLHADGRKITVSIKKGRMTVTAHTTGKKFETDINYYKSNKELIDIQK
jgi:hypothetical protein